MSEKLYDPTRHEPLSNIPWAADAVAEEIESIVSDIISSMHPDCSWPTHPLDAESYYDKGPKWATYAGAAGVVLALQIFSRHGYSGRSFEHNLSIIHDAYLRNPDVQLEPGLQLGELGILTPAFLACPDNEELSRRLVQCMEKTINLPFYEITSGQSGMMHVALYLYRKTGSDVWKDLYIGGASTLLSSWKQHSDTGQWLWQSKVFGPARHYYGACHGVAGNVNILLQGADLLDVDCTDVIIDRGVSTLELSAKTESDMANWILCTKPDIEKHLVQWCHGAAGIVTAMAATTTSNSANSKKLDRLLRMAGELVWKAGPLKKGSGICHGTAGNGYAFLHLHRRWGDSIWLARARKFAMHAIGQSRQARSEFGQGRYALWTGDAGLAIFLHHCLSPDMAALPGLELF